MSEKLKPCPFCGGEPGMVQQTKVNWAVMCHVCGAEGGWSYPSDAIALWNRRPTPPQAVPALTMDEGEVQFLAARLRRLFNHFEYPLPGWAKDDKHLIGIAPTCIGAVLANLAAPQPMRPDEPDRVGLCGYMDCDDEGMIDSGGVTPWGEWIRVPCPICNGAQS